MSLKVNKMKYYRNKWIKENKKRGGFDVTVKEKKCSKCREIKNIDDFSYSINQKDGFNHTCKVCSNIQNKIFNEIYKNKIDKTSRISKICFKCKIEKEITLFPKETKSPDGYSYKCKKCHIQNTKERRNKYKIINEQRGGFDKDLKEKKCKICNEIKEINHFVLSIYRKDGFNSYCKECNNIYYRKLTKQEKHIVKRNKYIRNKMKNNLNYKIQTLIRSSFKKAMKGGKIKASKDYGIDFNSIVNKLNEEFEKLDKNKKYHIDHIFPVSAFDHTNEKMIKLCWNVDNLQWLEEKENIIKSDKYDEEEFKKYLLKYL